LLFGTNEGAPPRFNLLKSIDAAEVPVLEAGGNAKVAKPPKEEVFAVAATGC
jgi:hypothetical protein